MKTVQSTLALASRYCSDYDLFKPNQIKKFLLKDGRKRVKETQLREKVKGRKETSIGNVFSVYSLSDVFLLPMGQLWEGGKWDLSCLRGTIFSIIQG